MFTAEITDCAADPIHVANRFISMYLLFSEIQFKQLNLISIVRFLFSIQMDYKIPPSL